MNNIYNQLYFLFGQQLMDQLESSWNNAQWSWFIINVWDKFTDDDDQFANVHETIKFQINYLTEMI